MFKLTTPLTREKIKALESGEEVLLTGLIYTARDQAHARLVELIKKGKKLPFDLKGAIIYYCGPAKTPKGKVIGSCGPTTSRRMDTFTIPLLKNGLAGMIGKGRRSREVELAIKKFQGVYFLTYAGCAALLSKYVCSAKTIAFADLGPEAVQQLTVKDFPLIVGIDRKGENIFRR
jgi:fumarate hydratase subunit beta